MTVGSSLWKTDRAAYYALNTWTRHRRGKRPLPIGDSFMSGSFRLVVAAPNLPWGTAKIVKPARASHMADRIFLVWQSGVLRGARMRWLCGAVTDEFLLHDEPVAPVCRACLARSGGSMVVNLSLHLTQVVMS